MKTEYLDQEFFEIASDESAPVYYHLRLSDGFNRLLQDLQSIEQDLESNGGHLNMVDAFELATQAERDNGFHSLLRLDAASGQVSASNHIERMRAEVEKINYHPSRVDGTMERVTERIETTLSSIRGILELAPVSRIEVDVEALEAGISQAVRSHILGTHDADDVAVGLLQDRVASNSAANQAAIVVVNAAPPAKFRRS